MLSLDNQNDTCFRILKRSIEAGNSVTTYISKIGMGMYKERIAASIITNKALDESDGFEVTLIKTVKKPSVHEVMSGDTKLDGLLQSNRMLSYRAILALMYYLRLNGMEVTDLVNTSYIGSTSLIAVEGIYGVDNILKISVSDTILPIIQTIIDESRQTKHERYTLKVLGIEETGGEHINRALRDAVLMSETITEMYQAGINGGTTGIDVLESPGKTFVIDDRQITCMSSAFEWDTTRTEELVDIALMPYELDCRLRTTSNIQIV